MPTFGEQYAANLAKTGGVGAQLEMGRQSIAQAQAAQQAAYRQQALAQQMQLQQMQDQLARERLAQEQAQFAAGQGLEQQRLGMLGGQFGQEFGLKQQQAQREQQLFDLQRQQEAEQRAGRSAMGDIYAGIDLETTSSDFLKSPIAAAIGQANIDPAMKSQLMDEEFNKYVQTQKGTGTKSNTQFEQKMAMINADPAMSQWPTEQKMAFASGGVAQQNILDTLATQNLRPALSPTGQSITGEEYISTLSPSIGNTVKAIAEGRMALPTGTALKSKYWQEILNDVAQYDPSFDLANAPSRVQTFKEYKTGQSAKNITALNTVMGHLEGLRKAADGLKNTNWPIVNEVKNWTKTQKGDPEVKRFGVNAVAVAHELAKVFVGSGVGALEDRREWMKKISDSASPAQMDAFFTETAQLLESRLSALNERYNQGMGRVVKEGLDFLDPKSQVIFNDLMGRTELPAAAGASGGAPVIGTVEQGYRFTGGDPANPQSWQKVQ